MRLINADELLEKMYRYNDNEGARMPYGDDDSLIHKDSACFLIENAPTIEPERKKGKWIDAVIPNDNRELLVQVCDQCNTFFPLAYTGGGHNFCPNCGADMRGEQDERHN